MATTRIIAHYMHETERDAALSQLTETHVTESYVVGDIEQEDIRQLQEKGLIVETISQESILQQPDAEDAIIGPRRHQMRVSRENEHGPAMEIAAASADDDSFYYVQLRGPLIEEWRERLERDGIVLLERYPDRIYKTRLSLEQLQQLMEAKDITQDVREVGARDTGPDLFTRQSTAPTTGVKMFTFDLRLHRPEDADAVFRWLEERGVAIAGRSTRKLRIYLPENSPLVDEIPALKEVASFEQYVIPKTSNANARKILGIDATNPGVVIDLEGEGQVVAIADTGLDKDHRDFANRISGIVALGRLNDPSDPDGHGTHVAGSVAGDGAASGGQIKGTAPKAKIFFQSIMDRAGELGGLPVDLNDLFEEAYLHGARIHNNSWGAATQSMYTINSIEVDEFVAAHRDMLIVVAAGNEGTSAQNANAAPGFVDWLSIGSPASCKNALTVGASRTDRTSGGFASLTWGQAWPGSFPLAPIASEKISGDIESLAAFSSRGPCDDRRIKPDVVAPGTDIVSAKSASAPLANFWGHYPGNADYAYMGGTSMAAPLVSGCAALVREYFETKRSHKPSAALLKTVLINGTQRLTGADAVALRTGEPNYHQGFGRVNMQRAIPNSTRPNLVLSFVDNWNDPNTQFATTGQRRRYKFNVPSGSPDLRVTLAYTDLPARSLQNNLNLFLQLLPSGKKWMGNQNLPDTLNIPDADNNVESIRIADPPAGTYLIQISATNLLAGPQDFALVVTGDGIGPLLPG